MKKKSKPQRIDPVTERQLRDVMRVRIRKGLADPFNREEISLREATFLARTTDNWPKVLQELREKPKRRKER